MKSFTARTFRAFFCLIFCSTFLVASFAGVGSAFADDFRVPALTGPVVDDANILSPEVRSALENGIRSLRDSGGSQITVATVPSLAGLEIEQASIKITDAWKLGGAKNDNGVLLLIAPTEHKVRIEVGQGLEGTLTDAFSNRIIRDVMTPYFRKGDYSNGVLQGVAAIIHYTDPTVDPASLFNGAERYSDRDSGREPSRGKFPWMLVVFGVFILFSLFRGGGGRGGRMSPWGAGALGYGLGRLGGGGGGWGGGGGGGGGGWSGGGGGFSGGGASGGW